MPTALVPASGGGSVASAQINRFDELRRGLDSQHMVVMRGFLSEPLLVRTLSEIERAEWQLHRSDLKTELRMVENRASALLHFLMNDAELFTLVQSLMDCGPIGRFRGRTYRMLPDADHTDNWHNDLAPGRVASISINLSPEPFEDGAVEMRDANTEKRISIAPALECGDAVLLRLRRGLEHRVRSVQGVKPKTAFPGFFYTDRISSLALPRVGAGIG